jgi:hypothetical protein
VQYLVGPILAAIIMPGIAGIIAVPATVSHKKKKNRTKYRLLLKMARARRKMSSEFAGTEIAQPTS